MSTADPTPSTELEPLIVEPAPPPPTWANVIPASFADLVAGIAGTALTAVVCYLAIGGVEAALQSLVAAFMLWLGWAIRGRVEATKNAPRPPEPPAR